VEYPRGEIRRVYLEYEDGTMEVTGEEAKKWKDMVEGQAILAHVHGQEWPTLNWIVELKEPPK